MEVDSTCSLRTGTFNHSWQNLQKVLQSCLDHAIWLSFFDHQIDDSHPLLEIVMTG
jgi:hypothetical protein